MGQGHYTVPEAPSGSQVYVLGKGERLELDFQILPGESKDVDIFVDLAGEGAEFSLKGLYLCGAAEKVNIRTIVHHRAPRCRSSKLVNGIASGSSNVSFYGAVGATVGQLDADALFYMRSRGIPEAEALHLLMLSFLSPVIPENFVMPSLSIF